MKKTGFILSLVLMTQMAWSQTAKKYPDADHFILKGNVYEIDHINETEGKAKDTQVVVFQDDEIYVAFNTSANGGTYEFYLPINYNYNIYYGGDAYVNKIVNIDARQFPSEKKPRIVKLNVGLFKPIEGYSFEMMKSPFVKVKYNPETDVIEPDFEYTEAKTDQVVKYFKKIKKDLGKKHTSDTKLKKRKTEDS
ncbi:MAG TPA: hypothetical protein VIK71_05605 [Flavobacteriales bacterium]